MSEEMKVVYVEKPEESAWEIIGRGLDDFNHQKAGAEDFQRLCFALTAPSVILYQDLPPNSSP